MSICKTISCENSSLKVYKYSETSLSPPVIFLLTDPRPYFFVDLFYFVFQGGASFADFFCLLCFMLVSVVLSCLFLVAFWSPAGKGLTSWLSCVLCCLVFCHFPKCVLVHIRIKGEAGAVKLV